MIERGWSLTEAEHERAQDERRAYCERMEAFFDDVDLLLTPTLPVTAFPAGRDQPGEVAGRPTEYLSWTAFTYPFNVSGQPAASVPCGMLDGLPVGLQIVGRAWRRRPGAARRPGVRAAATVVVRRPRSGINRLHGVNHLMPNRFRDLAGPVGLLPTGPRNTITDVPGVLVGHSQAGSGEPTGVTVVAPPRLPGARRRGDHQRRRRADQEAGDRRVGDRPDGDLPVRHARPGHRLPRRDPGRGRGSVQHADPGGRRVRRLRPGRRSHRHRRGRRRRPRGARAWTCRRAASAAAPG